MRARFRAPAYRLDRYRAAADPQVAMERWWAELARVFHRDDVRPGDTGDTGKPARQSAHTERGGEA